MTCLTLTRLQKSLMVGHETNIQTMLQLWHSYHKIFIVIQYSLLFPLYCGTSHTGQPLWESWIFVFLIPAKMTGSNVLTVLVLVHDLYLIYKYLTMQICTHFITKTLCRDISLGWHLELILFHFQFLFKAEKVAAVALAMPW